MGDSITGYGQHRDSKMMLKRRSQARLSIEKVDDRLGFLCFTLDDDEYGIDLHVVQQIVKPPPVTSVPRTSPHILGVISIRGAVVTLFDLRQIMGLESSTWPRSARVLIVESEDEQIGLLVDSVTLVRRVKDSEVEGGTSLDTGDLIEHVTGIFRLSSDKVVVLIDLDAILAEKLE